MVFGDQISSVAPQTITDPTEPHGRELAPRWIVFMTRYRHPSAWVYRLTKGVLLARVVPDDSPIHRVPEGVVHVDG